MSKPLEHIGNLTGSDHALCCDKGHRNFSLVSQACINKSKNKDFLAACTSALPPHVWCCPIKGKVFSPDSEISKKPVICRLCSVLGCLQNYQPNLLAATFQGLFFNVFTSLESLLKYFFNHSLQGSVKLASKTIPIALTFLYQLAKTWRGCHFIVIIVTYVLTYVLMRFIVLVTLCSWPFA